ncbi:MAG: ferredoxin reductase [Marmoricola sp.]
MSTTASDRPTSLGATLRKGIRQVAEMAATPLVPEDFLDLLAPLRAGADLRGRIVEIQPETPDAATILIQPGKDWRGHIPGQYLRIGVDVDGVRQWRAYSLTHGPRNDGLISVTVKAVPDGLVSGYLVHRTEPGTLVHLDQAAGDFVLPTRGGKFLMVTAGSGITPVIGMLRNLFPVTDSGVLRLPRSADFDIVVVHVAPSQPESIFLQNLQSLDADGAIKLIARYDDTHGILDVNDLDTLVPDLSDRITFACGPAGLLDALEQHHIERGLELQVEKFRTARVEPGDGGTLTVAGHQIEADGETTILDAAESAGVLMKSGCRMGICFGCVVPLEEGAVRDLRNGEVTIADPEESGSVAIQTCVTAVAGSARLSS